MMVIVFFFMKRGSLYVYVDDILLMYEEDFVSLEGFLKWWYDNIELFFWMVFILDIINKVYELVLLRILVV